MYAGILLLLVLAWRLSIGFVDSRVDLLGAGVDAASTNMNMETWHKQDDGLLFNQLTPAGFGLFDVSRTTGRGGGIIVVYKLQYKIYPVSVPPFKTFECLVLNVSASHAAHHAAMVIIYRPPKPNKDFFV